MFVYCADALKGGTRSIKAIIMKSRLLERLDRIVENVVESLLILLEIILLLIENSNCPRLNLIKDETI